MSSRVPRTASTKFSLSAETLRPPRSLRTRSLFSLRSAARFHLRAQLPKPAAAVDGKQRLQRVAQQIEQVAGSRAAVDVAPVGQQRQRAVRSDRIEEAHAKLSAQRLEQTP